MIQYIKPESFFCQPVVCTLLLSMAAVGSCLMPALCAGMGAERCLSLCPCGNINVKGTISRKKC